MFDYQGALISEITLAALRGWCFGYETAMPINNGLHLKDDYYG